MSSPPSAHKSFPSVSSSSTILLAKKFKGGRGGAGAGRGEGGLALGVRGHFSPRAAFLSRHLQEEEEGFFCASDLFPSFGFGDRERRRKGTGGGMGRRGRRGGLKREKNIMKSDLFWWRAFLLEGRKSFVSRYKRILCSSPPFAWESMMIGVSKKEKGEKVSDPNGPIPHFLPPTPILFSSFPKKGQRGRGALFPDRASPSAKKRGKERGGQKVKEEFWDGEKGEHDTDGEEGGRRTFSFFVGGDKKAEEEEQKGR